MQMRVANWKTSGGKNCLFSNEFMGKLRKTFFGLPASSQVTLPDKIFLKMHCRPCLLAVKFREQMGPILA